MSKEKPRLHLVAGNGDPELFNTELHWFFTCYDSECGLQSAQVTDVAGFQVNTSNGGDGGKSQKADDIDDREAMQVKGKKPIQARHENLPYNDRHATFESNPNRESCPQVFTRARRIWFRLSRVTWADQQLLRLYYEPRQVKASIPEHRIREAHRAYREVKVPE